MKKYNIDLSGAIIGIIVAVVYIVFIRIVVAPRLPVGWNEWELYLIIVVTMTIWICYWRIYIPNNQVGIYQKRGDIR